MKGCRPGKRRLAKVSKRRINCQSLWMRGAGGWGSRTICEPTIHAIRTSHGKEIKLYEVSNTWKMFLLGASGMWGLASGMFAESLGLGQLSLISVKRSFYWLGLWTHFTDWVKPCLGLNSYLQWLAFSECFPYYCFFNFCFLYFFAWLALCANCNERGLQ